ncbi:MAG: polysaccharide deacetylase family protein [Candidatus Acidiferrales bacterium]|jgi:peptidoglycan/xylan/chitin deacetylase (PgdA/CDA1 family)
MNPWLIAAPATLVAAGGVVAYGAACPQSQLFGPTIRRTASPRQLAITFDDGPNPALTPQLLNLLEREKTRATFFVVGRFVRQCPDVVREIAARGHAIGNHTETHANLFRLGSAGILDELRRCQDAIAEATGAAARWMRPPFGFRSPWLGGAVRELGLRGVVMWSVLPGDWRGKPAEWLIGRMQTIDARMERHRQEPSAGGDILCLHDGDYRFLNADRRATLAALEYWLPRWRDRGLEFVTIDSCAPAARR